MRFLISIILLVSLSAPAGLRVANGQSVDQTPRLLDEYGVYDAVIGDLFVGNKVTFVGDGNDRVDLLLIESRTTSHYQFYPSIVPSLNKDFRPATPPEPIRIVPSYGKRKSQISAVPGLETMTDYRNQNQQLVTLRRLFNLKVDYVLIDSQETKPEAFEKDGKQVGGVVQFSRVGFNSTRTQAVVFMSYFRPFDWIHGYGIFLVKEGFVWKVNHRKLVLVGIS